MQEKWALRCRKFIQMLDSLVNWMVLALMLPILLYGLYANWDTQQIYSNADSVQYESYKPEPDNTLGFDEIQSQNPDVCGWLTVYGTNIDYPIVQGVSNDSYINTDVFGSYSLSGSIFLDYRNRNDFSDFNSIIYGHHMENEVMFGEIDTFSDPAVFEEKQYGNIYYSGKDHGLEIMAYIYTDAYDQTLYNPAVTDDKAAYLSYVLSLARQSRETETLTTEDTLVLLSTCSATDTNGRDLLLCRVTDETFEDTFVVVKQQFHVDVEGLVGTIGNIPNEAWVIAFLVSVALLILWSIYCRRKRKREKANVDTSE